MWFFELGFFFMGAVCVRSFEMSLQKTYHISIGWGAAFFPPCFPGTLQPGISPYYSAPGTACEQFSTVDLLALLLHLSVFAIFPVTCCSVCQLWVNILGVVPVTWTVQVLVSECLFWVYFLVAPRLVDCHCCQLTMSPGCGMHIAPKLWTRTEQQKE